MTAHFILWVFSKQLSPRKEKKSTRRYTARKKRPASSILPVTDIKEEKQDRDVLQLFGFDLHKETRKTEETRVKTHNQSTVLPNCQVYEDTASLCVSAVTAHLTHLSKETRRVRTQTAHCKSPASKLDLVQANQ